MTYKTIKNKNNRYIRIEFGRINWEEGVYQEIFTSDVPELFEDITFERLDRMGFDTTDLRIVEVKLEEV